MGMASSQARLLTLTARMHQIEYKAARIEAQKLQLANDTRRVYEDYLDALDMSKIEIRTLNTDGSTTFVEFNAQDIYTYQGITHKQYTLETMDGKTLIPEDIHSVYQSTDTLEDFLKALGIASDAKKTIHHDAVPAKPVIDPEYYNKLNEYNTDTNDWKADEPKLEDFESEGTGRTMAQAFQDAGSSCYTSALSGSTGCYAHVLAHIIDYTASTGFGSPSDSGCNRAYYNSAANNHSTSTGRSFRLDAGDITGAGMDDRGGTKDVTMSMISAYLNKGELAPILETDPDFSNVNLTTEFDRLSSMYSTNGSPKTLKQWAKDLYYLCENYSTFGKTASDVTPTIITFQQHLVGSLNNIDADEYIKAYQKWVAEKPQEPNIADYTSYTAPVAAYDEIVDVVIAEDRDKAQWYTNIWNEMNNSDVKNYNETKAPYVSTVFGNLNTAYEVESKAKATTVYGTSFFGTDQNENYIVIPNDQVNNPNWLTNMVNDGFAILRTYVRKEESMIDTSVAVDTDLREVPDEKLIKKAEAKYEADMKRIDLKDTRYDHELAAIESERNAIKQEMETLKTVSKDNVERTFKLFS